MACQISHNAALQELLLAILALVNKLDPCGRLSQSICMGHFKPALSHKAYKKMHACSLA